MSLRGVVTAFSLAVAPLVKISCIGSSVFKAVFNSVAPRVFTFPSKSCALVPDNSSALAQASTSFLN